MSMKGKKAGILQAGAIFPLVPALASGLRSLGYRSDVLAFEEHPFGFDSDYYFPLDGSNKSLMRLITKWSIQFIGDYSVFHFHVKSFTESGIDLLFLRTMGKRVIIHHHGSDLRGWGEKNTNNRFAHGILVSTPDLLDWSPRATYLPSPILLDFYSNVGVEKKGANERIRIVHAPSKRAVKGTEQIIRTVDDLKRSGYNVELLLVEKMAHKEAIEFYRKADIIIDQINDLGVHGLVSIEAMALGKPVICSISSEYDEYYPSIPVVSSDAGALKSRLMSLIEDSGLRHDLGQKGRKYVESRHDPIKVASTLEKIYDL
ncbi:MAG: glycosyltransferase family 4 protein [Methanomassiliicoccales archaeon]|nr:glycosyltransferase family 4 protein [Methanomassiliicoccales archaeon]